MVLPTESLADRKAQRGFFSKRVLPKLRSRVGRVIYAMRTVWRLAGGWCRFLAVVGLSLMLAGCATQRVNWAARIGHYTYDQAVEEIGPPDKESRLQDGTVVAEWLTQRGYRSAYVTGGHYGWHHPYGFYGPYSPGYIESYSPDYFLRLTFGPDGQLKGWKKIA